MAVIPAAFSFGSKTEETDDFPQRLGTTYDFDFDTLDFVQTGVPLSVSLVGESPALSQQLEKLLRTRRYEDTVYDGEFGSTVQATVSMAVRYPQVVAESAVETAARESLLSDERVESVPSITATFNKALTFGVGLGGKSSFSLKPPIKLRLSGTSSFMEPPLRVRIEAIVLDTFGTGHVVDVTLDV